MNQTRNIEIVDLFKGLSLSFFIFHTFHLLLLLFSHSVCFILQIYCSRTVSSRSWGDCRSELRSVLFVFRVNDAPPSSSSSSSSSLSFRLVSSSRLLPLRLPHPRKSALQVRFDAHAEKRGSSFSTAKIIMKDIFTIFPFTLTTTMQPQRKKQAPIRLIVAGLPRTGTKSIRDALRELGMRCQ